MPIHDWTRVDAGLFHAFHTQWITHLSDALNDGALPSDYFALPEQKTGKFAPDVLTLNLAADDDAPAAGGVAVAAAPPQTTFVSCVEEDYYARKAHQITIRHRHGDVVAIVEIVSPGNKSSKAPLSKFIRKSVELIQQGIHLLVIDLFPPGPRDPNGIHKLIWDEFREEPFQFPGDKQRLVASYDAGPPWTAYVEPVDVGEALPDMPLFLRPEVYVPAPLESSYQTTWSKFPKPMRKLLE